MQFFKGDETELKFYQSGKPIFDILDTQKNLFFDGAYTAYDLGGLIYDLKKSPLSNAIKRDIFREAFKEIFDGFIKAGTFEAYIDIFTKIFGETVSIEFTVPAPGKLNIDIEADGVVLYDFASRYIEDNEYVFDEVIDDEDDNIVFQTVKGFTSQYELETMLFELVPGGIYTTISLSVG
jgi:hypothetical protein